VWGLARIGSTQIEGQVVSELAIGAEAVFGLTAHG